MTDAGRSFVGSRLNAIGIHGLNGAVRWAGVVTQEDWVRGLTLCQNLFSHRLHSASPHGAIGEGSRRCCRKTDISDFGFLVDTTIFKPVRYYCQTELRRLRCDRRGRYLTWAIYSVTCSNFSFDFDLNESAVWCHLAPLEEGYNNFRPLDQSNPLPHSRCPD